MEGTKGMVIWDKKFYASYLQRVNGRSIDLTSTATKRIVLT